MRRDLKSVGLGWLLAALVVGVSVPFVLVVSVLLWRVGVAEQRTLERQLQDKTRAIAAVLDRDMQGLLATVEVLAQSPHLKAGDYVAFELQARSIVERMGVNVVVRDMTGQQLFNTRLPRGAPLPRSTIEFDKEVALRRSAGVSDLVTGAVVQRPLFIVAAPVVVDGQVALIVNLSMEPKRVRDIVVESGLLSGMVVGVQDGQGHIVTRTVDHDRFVGQPAVAEFMDRVRRVPEDQFEGVGVDGTRVISSYTTLKLANWTVSTRVPVEQFNAPMVRSMWWAGLLAGSMAALGFFLAFLIGRTITRNASSLATAARALGDERPICPEPLSVRQLETVRQVLANAQIHLDDARQHQALLVQELKHRVKNTLATVLAVAQSSGKRATSVREFVDGFQNRLMAMAKTHDLLVERDWKSASMRDLLMNELGFFADDGSGRIRLSGPDVEVPGEVAVNLSMAFHELTTNAMKYGSLADPAGRVTVDWNVIDGTLVLDWREHDGPPVEQPKNIGFGTTLLDRVLRTKLQARVQTDYAPDGLKVKLHVPLARNARGASSP